MKPPYRVPSMAEVATVEKNGFSVISTFAGCGGSSLGYRMAGFIVLWANEFVDAAREVYVANASRGTIVDGRDIRTVDPAEVLRSLKMKPGELDVLDGSPPCASFSMAGKRAADWGATKKYSDTTQRTDDLFFEFIRFVKVMQPKVFVAENVSGLVKGVAKGYFLQILAAMKACGYRVEAKLLDAQWLGVPQARQRIIFVGVREDLGVAPAHPEPLPYRYSVRDALPSLRNGAMIGANGGFGKETWQSLDEPAKTIGTSPKTGNGRVGAGDVFVEKEALIEGMAIGRDYDMLNPGQASSKYFQLIRTDANRPSPTISARHGGSGVAGPVHPIEKRKFTIEELKQICGFPSDFIMSGHYAKDWERLGRAVPPLMARAIGETIRDRILLPWATAQKTKRKSNTSGPAVSALRPGVLSSEDSRVRDTRTSRSRESLKSRAASHGRLRGAKSRRARRSVTPATTPSA